MNERGQRPDLDLDIVSAPPLVDDQNDVRLAEEEQRWFEKEKKRVHLKGLVDDQEARRKWGERVFWLLVTWLGLVFLCVCAEGFRWNEFHISDSVLIALISTTTANVLSLGYIVAKYLFPKPPSEGGFISTST
jgi:hypothetical protein